MTGEANPSFRAASSDCLERAIGALPELSSRALGWDNCELTYWDVPPRSHEYESRNEVLLALHLDPKVNIELQINGQPCDYRTVPGMVTLVSPRSEIQFKPDGPFRFYMLHLPTDDISFETANGQDSLSELLLQFSYDSNLRQLISVMANEMTSQSLTSAQFVHSLSDTILHYLRGRMQDRNHRSSDPPWTVQAMAHVDRLICEAPDRAYTAREIASMLGLSKNRFASLVKNVTGKSPYKYILHKRIDMAEFMLRNSILSLSEVALSTGFASQSHFTESFHKAFGMTPARYRNHHRRSR